MSELRVALVGYGRMGREVDALAAGAGVRITMRLTSSTNREGEALSPDALHGTDVAIDFSTPQVVTRNLECYCEAGTNAVIGVTGWEEEREHALSLAAGAGIGLVVGSNFSVGANAFLALAKSAAQAMAGCADLFDLGGFEAHHRRKRDAPSGTALAMKAAVKSAGWPNPVNVVSRRLGHEPGTHELTWDSAVDTISLRHRARSRAGFALGALRAAHWINGKSGVYSFTHHWREIVGSTAPDPDPTLSG